MLGACNISMQKESKSMDLAHFLRERQTYKKIFSMERI